MTHLHTCLSKFTVHGVVLSPPPVSAWGLSVYRGGRGRKKINNLTLFLCFVIYFPFDIWSYTAQGCLKFPFSTKDDLELLLHPLAFTS